MSNTKKILVKWQINNKKANFLLFCLLTFFFSFQQPSCRMELTLFLIHDPLFSSLTNEDNKNEMISDDCSEEDEDEDDEGGRQQQWQVH